MDGNMIMQLISNLGFPIVVCGALFWKLVQDENAHKEETIKLTEALNNNTNAITKLAEKLNMGEVVYEN